MNLSDFDRVAKLRTEREYLKHLLAVIDEAGTKRLRLISEKVGYDLTPSLVEQIMPAIKQAVEGQIIDNSNKLAELGVEVI